MSSHRCSLHKNLLRPCLGGSPSALEGYTSFWRVVRTVDYGQGYRPTLLSHATEDNLYSPAVNQLFLGRTSSVQLPQDSVAVKNHGRTGLYLATLLWNLWRMGQEQAFRSPLVYQGYKETQECGRLQVRDVCLLKQEPNVCVQLTPCQGLGQWSALKLESSCNF